MPAAIVPFLPAIISGAASVGSALIGKKGATNAANTQIEAQGKAIQNTKDALAEGQKTVATATGDANDILSRSAATQIGMYDPYVKTGQGSLSSLSEMAKAGGDLDQKFSFDRSNLDNDPGFQFALEQGQKAIQQAAAAKGGLFSAATAKGLSSFATGTADQYFGQAFDRALKTFDTNRSSALSRANTLQSLAAMGLSGTNASANAVGSTSNQQSSNVFTGGEFNARMAQESAQNIGRFLTGQGDSKAAGIVSGTNAITGGISNGVKAINDFLSTRKAKNTGATPSFVPQGYTPGGDYDQNPWGG